MLTWNARSIVNKLTAFQSFISIADYKILAITESWLTPSIYDNEIITSLFRKDRSSGRGGGVFLAVHKSIPCKPVPSPHSLEVVSIEIPIPCKLIMCLIYIPPNAPQSYFQLLIQFLSALVKDSKVIFLGDFNLPDINWNNLHSNHSYSDQFCDFVCFIPACASSHS